VGSEVRLPLGQIAVDSKSNEIAAIPLPLELLNLKGATVTIDAIGCQKEIAAKIAEGGGDYVLALKDNHPKLHEAVAQEFTAAIEAKRRPTEMREHTTVETSRGRKERRTYTALHAPQSLPGFADWLGLPTLVMVVRITKVGGVEKVKVSYYLSSLPAKVKQLAG
jgi:predicted transposase YbfD/YdcC